MPGGLASCTFSKVSKFLKISFALLGASYNVVQLILHWVTSQRIVFWKRLPTRDSLRQGGTLDFLICTDSLSSLHCLLNVNSTEKLVVEFQSTLFYLDCDIHFSYVRGHSGNLGNGERISWPKRQLAKM
ncbi:RNase H domain-containing protein [Trichonephila clavipes]|nr:RNase H domain-containing protein [Trichonephila clavipes]